MGIAGSWKSGAVTPSEYVGALRQGTGYNRVHELRDTGRKPGGIKENLLPLPTDPQSDMVPEEVIGPEMWGYCYEDATAYAGEDYRYLEDDHPNWGDSEVGRADRDGDIMTEGTYPQPEGWPSWGPHEVPDAYAEAQFPLSGPPGGALLRSFSDGSDIENDRAVAVPTQGWRGGWLNKAHGLVEEAETSDPRQYEITTSMVQLHETRVNDHAVDRQTDDPRSPIETRLTGMKVKSYAKSSGMGGGPGTPDMLPVTQNLPYRPWFFRQGAMPPAPNTYFGTMTQFDPIERTLPVDAGEYVVTHESADPADPTYGYSEGDLGY